MARLDAHPARPVSIRKIYASGDIFGRPGHACARSTSRIEDDPTDSDPVALVAAYANASAPLERRGSRGPEQLESGAAILALDKVGQAKAVVAAYAALPRKHGDGSYGRHVMLGLLVTTRLRGRWQPLSGWARIPLDEAQLLAMVEAAACAIQPSLGPCDYDRVLVALLAKRPEAPSAGMKAALRRLAARRGTSGADSRRIGDACAALIAR